MMPFRLSHLSLAAVLLFAAPAPVRAAAEDNALRPEVGKPLQAAEGLVKQQKFAAALAEIQKAEAAAPLTGKETALVAHLRGIAAVGTGDIPTAVKSFETAIASGRLTPAEQLRLTRTVSVLYYQEKNFPNTIIWAKRALDAGGGDEQTRTLLAQAYYLSEDWPAAGRTLHEQIGAAERAGRTPAEAQLQLLANIELKQNNTDGYETALEKLVSVYPQPHYWAGLIQCLSSRPGFPRRLMLDVYRLSKAVGAMSSATQYTEAAELALQSGLPGEARILLDQGFAAGLLGHGPGADRQERLRALAAERSTDDLKSLPDQQKAATDGAGLVMVGLDYLGHGRPQEAAALIEQGLAKGVTANPEDAKLHLGIAYYAAGLKNKSLEIFRAVQGAGDADLARLWAIHSGSPLPG
jgi:tetratricopeptide (TPR) repeat protein